MDFPIAISVVMPVFNTSVSILKEAVESILNQTFQDYEFIIIDDGSTNGSWDYLNNIGDKRVRLFRNTTNLGITKSLNIGFQVSRGKYIARMDSDDISLPDRFEKQYAFMESHPDVALCGAKVEVFGDYHYLSGGSRHRRETMEDYRIRLLFVNPGPYHPTIFIRHEVLLVHHIDYNENLIYAQDYGLYATISNIGRIVILEQVLLQYRMHREQISRTRRETQILCDKETQRTLLSKLLYNITEAELDLHYTHSTGYYPGAKISPKAADWYKSLIKANDQRRIYNRKKFREHVGRVERRLVEQTFTVEMSATEKLMLAIRYLSLPSIIKIFIKMFLLRSYSADKAKG